MKVARTVLRALGGKVPEQSGNPPSFDSMPDAQNDHQR